MAARDAAIASRRIVPMTWTAYTLAAADAALGRNVEAAQVLAEHHASGRTWICIISPITSCSGGALVGRAPARFSRSSAISPT